MGNLWGSPRPARLDCVSDPSIDDLLVAVASDTFLLDLGVGQRGTPELITEALERLVEALSDEVVRNSEQYDMVADQLELGGAEDLRSKLTPALVRDLADFDAGPAVTAAKGLTRLYWLAVALADRRAPDGHAHPQEFLQRIFDVGTDRYVPVYRRFAELLGREGTAGTEGEAFETLRGIIRCQLDGVTVARRLGRAPSDADVVTAVLSLFRAFTTRSGEGALEPEVGPIGEDAPTGWVRRNGVISAEGEGPSYALAVNAFQALRTTQPRVIRHYALHGQSGAQRPSEKIPLPAQELRQVMLEMLRAGWSLLRLVTVHSERDLDREVEVAGALRTISPRVQVRATVGGAGHAAALIVEGRFVSLGLDDPHTSYVGRSILTEQSSTIAFWVEQFDQVFADRRQTLVISGPAGLDQGGIAELRRRVRGLSVLLSDPPDTLQLSERQREVVGCLSRNPRPQLQEIAQELHISRDAVKKHCENLEDKLGIPRGRDRLSALIAELRRRGLA